MLGGMQEVPNDDPTSSVVADYFDDGQCIPVASSLEEYFGRYVEDPCQVLERPHPGRQQGRRA